MKPHGPPRNHISGRDYTTAIRGALLTDARIEHYARQGWYGPEAQRAQARPAKRKRIPRQPKLSISQILDAL